MWPKLFLLLILGFVFGITTQGNKNYDFLTQTSQNNKKNYRKSDKKIVFVNFLYIWHNPR